MQASRGRGSGGCGNIHLFVTQFKRKILGGRQTGVGGKSSSGTVCVWGVWQELQGQEKKERSPPHIPCDSHGSPTFQFSSHGCCV